MRAAFNCSLLSEPSLRGWNRYTVNLLAALARQGVELYLYCRQPVHPDHLARLPADSYQICEAPAMRLFLWEHRWIPQQCRADRIDIYHSPFNFGMPRSLPCPGILTLHDAIEQVYYYPQLKARQILTFAHLNIRFRLWYARRCAVRIITDSEHARSDIAMNLRYPRERIDVVHLAADPHFHEPLTPETRVSVRSKYRLDKGYFFYVGGWEQRKNIGFLLRGFAAANCPGTDLVLAGGLESQKAEIQRLGDSLGISSRLRLAGWVDETDLPALYGEAEALVYPSEYEGFGFQLCEAMACGCPVLAARATSLPEVLGDGGRTFALGDPAELAGLLSRIAIEKEFRDSLRAAAKLRSKAFSWERTARETIGTYERALSDYGTAKAVRPRESA